MTVFLARHEERHEALLGQPQQAEIPPSSERSGDACVGVGGACASVGGASADARTPPKPPSGLAGAAHFSSVAFISEAGTWRPPKLHRSFADASKKAPQDRCLSLFCAGSKTIDLEVLGDVKERDAFAWAFDKIIGEARATRIFVDKAGAPVARSEPKKRLRMILGAH